MLIFLNEKGAPCELAKKQKPFHRSSLSADYVFLFEAHDKANGGVALVSIAVCTICLDADIVYVCGAGAPLHKNIRQSSTARWQAIHFVR